MSTKIDLALPVAPGAGEKFSNVLNADRLIRLHPHWHVGEIVQEGDRTIAQLKDHATEKPFALDFVLSFPTDQEILISCSEGPANTIHFFVENQRLHLAYRPHGEQLTTEEEQNLTLWSQSIRQYLRLYVKQTPYTRFFRLLMNKVILKMDPSQRKICLMLYRFTLLEIVVILIIVIGYFTFGRS